jgi:FXSXX-COOH protein
MRGAAAEADRAPRHWGVKKTSDHGCAYIRYLNGKCLMDSSAGMREAASDPASPSRIPVDLRDVSLAKLRVHDDDAVRHMVQAVLAQSGPQAVAFFNSAI